VVLITVAEVLNISQIVLRAAEVDLHVFIMRPSPRGAKGGCPTSQLETQTVYIVATGTKSGV
jgi:hypothetical protein